MAKIDFMDVCDPVTGLSGGQIQRLAIARALYRSTTKVLIFDESTNALDSATEEHILGKVISYCKTNRIILVVITHHTQVYKMADQLIQV